MGARSRARRRAVEILFEADLRALSAVDVLEARPVDPSSPMNPYVGELVRGVTEHRVRIDELLTTYSQGWPLDRMPNVDRNVLRLGAYELLWRDDVPDAVCIDEAVDLAKSMSTDSSPTFVNGLLGRLQDLKPTLVL